MRLSSRRTRRSRFLLGTVAVAFGLLLSVGPAGAALPTGPSTEHTSAGAGTSGGRELPAMSADGTRVVYVGRGSADQGLWLTDRTTGTTYRLTTGMDFNPDISVDGNTVAYAEYGSTRPVFIRDITDPASPGPAILVSKSTSGEAANGLSDFPSLNADGTVVAFQSMATNLDPNAAVPSSGGPNKVYVRDLNPADRTQGTTEMVSVDNSGAAQPGNATFPDLSDSGRFVTFASEADLSGPVGLTAAAEEETTTVTQIWLRDRTTRETVPISVADDGTIGNAASAAVYGPKISGDGTVISFESDASNLVPADTNGHTDAFEHHVLTGTTTRVSERTPTTELGAFHALTPTRLLDTRLDPGTPLGPGETVTVQVGGVATVPADAAGAALNVTVTEPDGPGYLTVYPTDAASVPLASSINWTGGQTIANAVTVKLAADGSFTIANPFSSVHVVVDLAGWYDAAQLTSGGGFVSTQPTRVLDTRLVPGTKVAPGQTVMVPVTGGQVPADAQAVALSVTVTETSGPGYLTVYPSDATMPTASNLNWAKGDTIANSVVVRPGADGMVAIHNPFSSIHLIVDVDGWFDAALPNGGFTPVEPTRALDTRSGAKVGPGGEVSVGVLGKGGVPTDGVTAVALNVTVTEPTAWSYLTVYPTGTVRPTASNLNFSPGQTIAVQVLVQVGAGGKVTLYNALGATHVVVDITGWYSGVQVSEGGLGAVVSHDGAHVAFESDGTTMTPGDVNGVRDAFIRDLGMSPLTTRVSVVDETLGGTEATGTRVDGHTGEVVPQINGYDVAVSSDGSMVSFVSNGNLTNDRVVDTETGGISTEPAVFTRTRS